MLRFDRVLAPSGKARFKRKPKAVAGVANAELTCVGEALLHADNELSSLLVLGSKVMGEKNFVLLSFTVDTVDGKRSSKLQEWFQVVDGSDLSLSVKFVSKILAAEEVLPLFRKKVLKRNVTKVKNMDRMRFALR